MYLHQNTLTIRDALPADAPLLCRWWNDGKIMEHAGLFPCEEDGSGNPKGYSIFRGLSRKGVGGHFQYARH